MPTNKEITTLTTLATKLKLLPEQIQFAHYMATPKAKREELAKLSARIGVNQATLWRWKSNKRVLALAKELMKRYFVDDLADILEAMKVKALQGDTAAAKLVIEYIEDFMQVKNAASGVAQVNIYVSEKDVKARIEQLRTKIIDI